MILIVNNYTNGGSTSLSKLVSMWKQVLVVDAREALRLAKRRVKPELIILSGSDLDPKSGGIWVEFTQIRVPVIAICYSMQCMSVSLGEVSNVIKVKDYDRRTTHTVDGVGTVKSNHKWVVVKPPPGARDVKWYSRVGVEVVAEFTYRNVRAYQYHPELLAHTRQHAFGKYSPVKFNGGGYGSDMKLSRSYMESILSDHAAGSRWFSLATPGNVKRIVELDEFVKVVYIDHNPEDDPEWAIDFPKVFHDMMYAIRKERPDWKPPTERLVVVKSFCRDKRKLPPEGIYPRPVDVNGGMFSPGTDAIHVYREEESLKVSIHEALHWTGLEHTLDVITEPVPACVGGYKAFTEAWVEFHAARLVNGRVLKKEKNHVFSRCAAILKNIGYGKPQEFLSHRCSKCNIQKSDVFSYFFLRAAIFLLPRDLWTFEPHAKDILVRAMKVMKTKVYLDEITKFMANVDEDDNSLRMTTTR